MVDGSRRSGRRLRTHRTLQCDAASASAAIADRLDAHARPPWPPGARGGPWDGDGGRHSPAYVKGWDPGEGKWVDRIYYAGAADNLWGPYTIGFLQWDRGEWLDQPEPAFAANEEWEHGSMYEPNLVYH